MLRNINNKKYINYIVQIVYKSAYIGRYIWLWITFFFMIKQLLSEFHAG